MFVTVSYLVSVVCIVYLVRGHLVLVLAVAVRFLLRFNLFVEACLFPWVCLLQSGYLFCLFDRFIYFNK